MMPSTHHMRCQLRLVLCDVCFDLDEYQLENGLCCGCDISLENPSRRCREAFFSPATLLRRLIFGCWLCWPFRCRGTRANDVYRRFINRLSLDVGKTVSKTESAKQISCLRCLSGVGSNQTLQHGTKSQLHKHPAVIRSHQSQQHHRFMVMAMFHLAAIDM